MTRSKAEQKHSASRSVGRPSKYDASNFPRMAYEAALLGCTDKSLAKLFAVDEATIVNWKHSHEEFFQSIKDGTEIADSKVAASLYKRACGYEYNDDIIVGKGGDRRVEQVTKHIPPDTNAARLWLMNRKPDKWRDKQTIEATVHEKKEITLNIAPEVSSVLTNLRNLTEKEELRVIEHQEDTDNE